MKKITTQMNATRILTLLSCFAFASTAHAQSTFSGGSISDAGNWSAGLPTGGTSGTMNVNGTISASTTGFDVTQTGGDLAWSGGFTTLIDSTWTLESGASWSGTNDTFLRGSTINLNSGASISGNEFWVRDTTLTGGGNIDVGDFQITHNASINLTGSTVDASGFLGHRSTGAGNGTLTLSDADVTTGVFRHVDQGSTLQLNLEGAAAGFFSFGNWATSAVEAGADENILVDFASGTGMVMSGTAITRGLTIGGTTYANSEWAEALWEGDQLTLDGQTSTDLGTDWATANGTLFSFDGTNLSVVPEPSAFGLIAGLMASMTLLRRRRA